MKLKKNFIKGMAMSMALSMLFCNTAFATEIDLADSVESVITDTLTKIEGTDHFDDEDNEWADGTINEEVRVTVDLASKFTITIPKEIVLDGETGRADYVVNAKGDIAGDQVLKVVPDPDFVLSEKGGKDDQTATVTQENTDYTYVELQGEGTDYPGVVQAQLTAGEWAGRFNFNINFTGGQASEGEDTLPEVKATLNDYTWAEISAISKSGEAETTYGLKVGDTKEMTLSNGETYNVEIIGFEHDDLADGSGTAGITFQFKELMSTTHIMDSTNTNVGGWETSEMRTYLKDDVYSLLPADLQGEIKEVTKVSDAGNKDKTTLIETTDKLFLLSFEEVGFTSSDGSRFVAGQGTKYEIYSDKASRIKYLSGSAAFWWLRSAYTGDANDFFGVSDGGGNMSSYASSTRGVAPAFCI